METHGDEENWNYSRHYSSSFHGVFGISNNSEAIQTPDNLPKSDEATVLKRKLPRQLIQICMENEGTENINITLPILVTVQIPKN